MFFQLLRKNPDKRLGSSERDAEDVKKQAFFQVSRFLWRYALVKYDSFTNCTVIVFQSNVFHCIIYLLRISSGKICFRKKYDRLLFPTL